MCDRLEPVWTNAYKPLRRLMHFSRVSSIGARVITPFVVLLLAHVGLANDACFQGVTVDAPGTVHQLWLVSTRGASSCPRLDQTSRLRYWRCDPDCNWSSSSVSEMLGSDDPATTTLIYVHENRVSEAESFRRASKGISATIEVCSSRKTFPANRGILAVGPHWSPSTPRCPDQGSTKRSARSLFGLVAGSDPSGCAGHLIWL